MKVVAIDAGSRGSALSRSVAYAAEAARAAGAEVEVITLGRLRIRRCTECGICQLGGRCRIEDDLPALAERLSQADGVIYGVPEHLFRSDERTTAVVRRLSAFFVEPVGPGCGDEHGGSHIKRAIMITESALPVSVATFFGYKTGPLRRLRDGLGLGGFMTVGSLVMNGNLTRARFGREQAERARSLGRVLVGRV